MLFFMILQKNITIKRYFLSLVLFITTVSAYSQVSYGGYTVFPDAKLYG